MHRSCDAPLRFKMSGIVDTVGNIDPSDFSDDCIEIHHEQKKRNSKKCYTCTPRGTLKEHIISQTGDFIFNHDMFRRPLIIITSVKHYHTIYEMPDYLKLKLFEDINSFVEFWNLTKSYQLMINNGETQTHHHFHVKMRIDESIANRMRRDHFTRINLEKTYLPHSK